MYTWTERAEGKKRWNVLFSYETHPHRQARARGDAAAAHNMHMCGGEKAKDINL
jgi:hypothetical protein